MTSQLQENSPPTYLNKNIVFFLFFVFCSFVYFCVHGLLRESFHDRSLRPGPTNGRWTTQYRQLNTVNSSLPTQHCQPNNVVSTPPAQYRQHNTTNSTPPTQHCRLKTAKSTPSTHFRDNSIFVTHEVLLLYFCVKVTVSIRVLCL